MKILITGGSSGIGLGCFKYLAGLDGNHEIIILCRNKEKGESVIKDIETKTKKKNFSMVLCDLAKLNDVKNVIKDIQEKHEFLDVLFVNAGLGYVKNRVETEDSYERTFQVNYLSHFLLTLNLLDLLEKSEKGGRVIVNVTKYGKIKWDDLQQQNCKWNFEQAVVQSLALKRMFVYRLNTLFRKRKDCKLSVVGVQTRKTIWSSQVSILPLPLKMMAYCLVYPCSDSIDRCGLDFSPMFIENQEDSLKRSGKLINGGGEYKEIKETKDECVFDEKKQEELWKISLDLLKDEETNKISEEYC